MTIRGDAKKFCPLWLPFILRSCFLHSTSIQTRAKHEKMDYDYEQLRTSSSEEQDVEEATLLEYTITKNSPQPQQKSMQNLVHKKTALTIGIVMGYLGLFFSLIVVAMLWESQCNCPDPSQMIYCMFSKSCKCHVAKNTIH